MASAVHARLRTSTAASTSPHTPSDSSPVPEGWADDSSGAAPSLSPQSKNASAAVVGDFRSDGDLVENGTPECTEEKRATTRSVALGGRADTIDANDGQALPVMNGDSPAEKASLSWDEHEELEEDDTIEGEEAYEMLMVRFSLNIFWHSCRRVAMRDIISSINGSNTSATGTLSVWTCP